MFWKKIRNWQILSLFAVLAFMLVLLVPTASAKDSSENDSFKVVVVHGINGEKLGLSEELPVVAIVQRDGEVIAEIPLEYKDKFRSKLPAGNYLIQIKSVELDTIIDSMTVGPVDIPAGVKVSLLATLDEDNTPIVEVKVKESDDRDDREDDDKDRDDDDHRDDRGGDDKDRDDDDRDDDDDD